MYIYTTETKNHGLMFTCNVPCEFIENMNIVTSFSFVENISNFILV